MHRRSRLLRKTGLAGRGDAGSHASTCEVWIARFGRVVEKKPNAQFDILYDGLVNADARGDPAERPFHSGQGGGHMRPAPNASTSPYRTGEEISLA